MTTPNKPDPNKPERFPLAILGASEDLPRLITAYGRGCGGEVALVIRPREDTAFLLHQVKKQPAMVWRTDLGLAPSHAPEQAVSPDDALGELRKAKATPPPPGPATLKGKWTGALLCTNGTPSVTLTRKVASYGELTVVSTPDGRWTASFGRATKWFSKQKQESVTRSSLAFAVQAGMGLVIGLVSEACSFRDTHRRNTVDPEFAARYPVRPDREPKDRSAKYTGRGTFSAVEKESGWAVVNAVGAIVALFGPKEKGKAQKHASALTRGAPTATVSADIADGFGLSEMPGIVTIPALDDLPVPKVPSCPTSTANIAEGVQAEAHAIEVMADSLWGSTEAPELLGRAGKLIRHAQSLVRSPLCTGKEQQMATEDVRRAADAYEQAHSALARGEKPDIVTTLRRIAERVALAAARAGKQCAGGQKKLDGLHRTPDQVATSIGQKEAGWTWGDRVTWKGRVWVVRDVRADGSVDMTIEGGDLAETVAASDLRAAPRTATGKATVTMQPVWPPAAPTQRVATTRALRTPKPAAGDPAKDKVLMDAFAQAIAAAAQSMRPAATSARETLPAVGARAAAHRPLTDAEHAVVAAYAKEYGRSWKQALNDDWSNARTRGPLQRIRNELGPEWLEKFKLTTRESCPAPTSRPTTSPSRAVSR